MPPASSSSTVGTRGARVGADGVAYAVWAPDRREMRVVVERAGRSRDLALERQEDGHWTGHDADGRAGDLYRFRLDDESHFPDPASRFQPQGVHGPSECIDPEAYAWECGAWKRPSWSGQPIYELHTGALTEEGTFRAALSRLDLIRDLGVGAIELMPVADFAGDRNWGYDGVALYAPARCYGRPDDLRALVDAAHARGLAVILDVVYNHLGPAGNYLHAYCADYFRTDRSTPWGQPFNVDGPRSREVRAFLTGNVAYWLDEFRLDGLRLDATHAIPDDSSPSLLAEIAETAHARGAFVIAEDERNEPRLLGSPDAGGSGLDALWADDFHHQIRVALTGARHAHFAGYRGAPADVSETLEHGWTYRGQPFLPWNGRPRGEACDHLPARAFVFCIENHDQVGNRAQGERLEHLTTPAQFRAASMLLCLSPYAPLLFMGQEWAASSPFLFFTNHGGDLGRAIVLGRNREFEDQDPDPGGAAVPDPEAPSTFERSKLRWQERADPDHAAVLRLYQDCLRERRGLERSGALERKSWRVHNSGRFVAIRYDSEQGERMLLVTFRPTFHPVSFLLGGFAPPAGHAWEAILDSNAERFGGPVGAAAGRDWSLHGPGAVWLAARREGGG